MLRQLRFLLDSLRQPFVAAAVLVLSLGIGALATSFSLFDQAVLGTVAGIPPERQARLVSLEFRDQEEATYPASFPLLLEITRQSKTLQLLAGAVVTSVSVDFGAAAAPKRIQAKYVTESFFQALGVEPWRGRSFTPQDFDAHQRVAFISHRLQREAFGDAGDAQSRRIFVNDEEFAIAGIAPPRFQGASHSDSTDLWIPIQQSARLESRLEDPQRGMFFLLLAALAPEADAAAAQAELTAFASTLDAGAWGMGEPGSKVRCLVLPGIGHDSYTRQSLAKTFQLMFGVTAFIALLAGFNATGLLLSRALSRRRNWAVMSALGAGRWKIAWAALRESIAVAAAAALIGIGLAAAGHGWLAEARLVEHASGSLTLSFNFLVFNALLALLIVASAGGLPAWIVSRSDPAAVLRDPQGQAGRISLFRTLLVGAQYSLTFVLLLAALLFLKSLDQLYSIELGYRSDGIICATVEPRLLGYETQQREQLYRGLQQRLDSDPDLQSAALVEIPPFVGTIRSVRLVPEDSEGSEPILAWRNRISPGYLETLGLRLVAGRAFRPQEALERHEGAAQVAILSQSVAQQLWPASNPVGQRFKFQRMPEPVEVVGIVEDHRTISVLSDAPLIYEPLGQGFLPSRLSMVARTGRSLEETSRILEGHVLSLEGRLPIFDVERLSDRLDANLSKARLFAQTVPLLAGIALILASLGLWGLTAGFIRLQTRELGIRMALGADTGRLRRQRMLRTALLLAASFLLALGLCFTLQGFVAPQLHQVSALDPRLILTALAVLFVTSLLASYLPLYRLREIDPAQVLKNE